MKLKLDTDLIQMINVNSYTTICNVECFEEYDWNIDGYKKILKNILPSILQEIYQQIFTKDISVKPIVAYSPQYYNYSGDGLEYTLKFDKREYNNIFKKITNDNNFWEYIKKRYASYDGFISFLADNKTDFYKQDFTSQFASIIQYIFDTKIKNTRFYDNIIQEYYGELLDQFAMNFELYEIEN